MAIPHMSAIRTIGSHIVLPLSLLVTQPALASDSTANAYTVPQLMEVSGTNRSLSYFTEQVGPELIDQLVSLDNLDTNEIDVAQLRNSMTDQLTLVFSAKRLKNHVEMDLEESLSQKDIDSVTRFYKSELGQKIDGIYAANTDTATQEAMYEEILALDTSTLDQERLKLAESIMTSTSTHELLATLMIESLVSPLVGMSDALPKDAAQAWSAETNFTEFMKHVESMRPVIEQQTLQFLTLSDYLTLAELNDDEYQQYASLFKSNEGRNFITAVATSMMDFTKSAFYSVGHKAVKTTMQMAQAE